MAKGLLFDLDGTLFDTYHEIYAAAEVAARIQGIELAADEETARSFMGGGLSRFAKRVLTGEMWAEPDPDVHQRLVTQAQQEYASLLLSRDSLYPGVAATLAQLREEGWKLAIATNKLAVYTEPLLQRFLSGIEFDCVLCKDMFPKGKPDPAMVHAALEQLGLQPAQALFVGDSPVDVAAARAAGVPMALVSYGYHQGADPREAGADYLLDAFPDLLPLCARLS